MTFLVILYLNRKLSKLFRAFEVKFLSLSFSSERKQKRSPFIPNFKPLVIVYTCHVAFHPLPHATAPDVYIF